MTHQVTDDLRRAMEDAALLACDDPRRREVLARIDEAGVAAREAWSEIQKEYDRLPHSLRLVNPPAGLEERLFKIPSTTARSSPLSRRGAAILAAAVILSAAVSGLIWLRPPASGPGPAERLAALAIRDHARHPVLTVRTSDRAEVESRLGSLAPFQVRVPALGARCTLVGGRLCKFGSRPLIYTRWQGDGRERSLYQVLATDFDLPQDFLPTEIITPPTPAYPSGHRVVIWADGGSVFALVCAGDDMMREPGVSSLTGTEG